MKTRNLTTYLFRGTKSIIQYRSFKRGISNALNKISNVPNHKSEETISNPNGSNENHNYQQHYLQNERMIRDRHLKNITVTSFYSQSAIESASAKSPTRLTPLTMMYAAKSEDKSHIMRSAHYLHKDLPIRLAHRIDDFRNLPFVVACNPRLLELHERFIKMFHSLYSFPPIKTLEQEKLFTDLLQCTLDSSSDTLPLLAEGFRETKRHIKQATLVRNFLDRALTSRLCMRILIEHHIQLHEEKPNYTGAICLSFSPKKLIEKSADLVTKLCKAQYGVSPEIRLDGHVNSTFPFIPIPLHYIVPEMLKNAFRATVEHHLHSDNELPCINVTVAVNDDELILRIRDRGGGMKRSVLEKIFDYHFTTTDSSADLSMMSYSDQINDKLFDKFILRETNKMSGYGFGVPTSRAFCEYFNGSLSIETMFGIGTDVYIRLGLLTSEKRVVRL